MINTKFNDIIIARYGTESITGTVDYESVIYPNTIGVIVRKSGLPKKSISLDCVMIFPDGTSLNDIEASQHNLFEAMASAGKSTLELNNVEIPNCLIASISFDKVVRKIARYSISVELGKQNTYNGFESVTYNQYTGPTNLKQFRHGTFEVTGFSPFYFGQQVEQLKSVSFSNYEEHESYFELEKNVIQEGGLENIKLIGWTTQLTRQQSTELALNIINGPLGMTGTLTVGTDETTYAFMTSFSSQSIRPGFIIWEAAFVSSLKC